jgi:hypothetical protein
VDFTTPYRIPLSWLLEHGSESVRLRTLRELAPPGQAGLEALEALVVESKAVQAVTRKQKDDGSWGGSLLGILPSAKDGIKEPGTIAQHRRLTQLAYPRGGRAFKLADRILFRVLSRDEDPGLLFEYQKLGKDAPASAEWLRDRNREAATAALAESGFHDDPRVRGAAHKVASAVSAFLRSPLADKPFARSGGATILHHDAHPPTWYSLAMVAAMPMLRRERAAFTERLGQYLSTHAPKRSFVIQVGKKSLNPADLLLGDPTETDSKGNVPDIPFALVFYEQMARIGGLAGSPLAGKVLGKLESECDESGVWRPKKLAAPPRTTHAATYHAYPLNYDDRVDSRLVDVTFRLALIAKVAGRPVEYT